MPEQLLTARGVGKTYGVRPVLQDFSLDLGRGEIHALLGQNGSGKSTFIKIVAGYVEPDDGTQISALGTDLRFPLRGREAQGLGVAFVHQDLGLLGSETVFENFLLSGFDPSDRVRINWSRRRSEVRESLESFGVDIDLDRPVSEASDMERAMIAIVRAIASLRGRDAGILILDEPTPYLPRDGIDRLFAVMREASAAGFGILFVTHRLDEVWAVADRVSVLRDGKLVANSAVADLDERTLVQQILGFSLDQYYPEQRPAATGAPVLHATGVSGNQVRDLDLTVGSGEIVGITGLLGMGWEEVPYLLFGATSGSGSIELAGKPYDIGHLSPAEAIRGGLALLPGDRLGRSGIGAATVLENVTLPTLGGLYTRGLLRLGKELEEVKAALEEFGVVPPDPHARFASLSGGNQQKALLAKWFRTNPTVYLMHEPTQGVDVGARKQIFERIAEARARGTSILIASSEYEDLAHVCDRVLVLRDGRVVSELHGDGLTPERISEQCFARASTGAESAGSPIEGVG